MENALRTSGVARRRPAAEPEQVGHGADRADARPAGGTRRSRPGAHVRQGLEREPRHRLRHLPQPGVSRGGRTGAVDRHGRERARAVADARPGTPVHPAQRAHAGQHGARRLLSVLGRPRVGIELRIPDAGGRHPPPRAAQHPSHAGDVPGREPGGDARGARRPRSVREPERARGARRQRFRRGVAGSHAAPARHSGVRVQVHRRLPRDAHERARLPARRHGDRRLRDPGAHPDRLTVRSLSPARRCGVDRRAEARCPALLRRHGPLRELPRRSVARWPELRQRRRAAAWARGGERCAPGPGTGRALQPGVLQVCLPRVAAPQRRADGALHARRGVPHAGSSAEALQRCAARAARVRYVATTAGAATDVSRR